MAAPANVKLVSTEISIGASAANSVSKGTLIRLNNTSGGVAVLSVYESDGTTLAANTTLANNEILYLEKKSEQLINASATILATKVAY